MDKRTLLNIYKNHGEDEATSVFYAWCAQLDALVERHPELRAWCDDIAAQLYGTMDIITWISWSEREETTAAEREAWDLTEAQRDAQRDSREYGFFTRITRRLLRAA